MAKKPKNRIRTEKELAAYARGLKEFADVLDGLGLFWFLACGALLGAYRDGDLVPWDHDVDVELKEEEAKSRSQKIHAALKSAGFRTENRTYGIRAKKYGHKYAIRMWQQKGNMRTLGRKQLPDYFFKNLSSIKLRDSKYPCPSNVEKYLEWKYGKGWRTPTPRKKTSHGPHYKGKL